MGRKKKKYSKPFVMIYKEMLYSEAWKLISNASRVAYLHLKSKCISPNNDEITLSYKEMEEIMGRDTYARSTRQLVSHGFIIKEQRGGLYRKRNFYRLSEEWKNYSKNKLK